MTRNHRQPQFFSKRHPERNRRLSEAVRIYKVAKRYEILSRRDLAELFHCTVESIRQTELMALWKLKQSYDKYEHN